MDPPRNAPPVAVRVMRPFATEDDLLAAESTAFTRTGVVLVGAPSRPNGVVLRFEICLRDGTAVMRGEGRVVGYRAASSAEESALMMRFTRLDLKSKDLLDRAVTMREERRSQAPPKPPSSVAPTTDRDPGPESAPPRSAPSPSAPPPVVVAPVTAPTPAAPSVDIDVDDDDAMDVDDADLTSADEDDQTVQAPPVAMIADMRAAGPAPKEKAPMPQPSPAGAPVPQPSAPIPHAPPQRAPAHAPPPQQAPKERMPIPTRSPDDKHRAAEVVARLRESRPSSSEFRPSLAPEQRDSALERLRKRPSRV